MGVRLRHRDGGDDLADGRPRSGARVAGVGYYIDGQLAGGWGQGHRFYLNGPFFPPPTAATAGRCRWRRPTCIARSCQHTTSTCVRRTAHSYVELDAATQTQALNDLRTGKAVIPLAGSTAFTSVDFFIMFRQNVLEGMLADPSYGGNRGMVGWKWIGFPGDPMRRGDVYYKYVFTDKPYPYEHKPLLRRSTRSRRLARRRTTGRRRRRTRHDNVKGCEMAQEGGRRHRRSRLGRRNHRAELTKAGLSVVGLERGRTAKRSTVNFQTTTTSSATRSGTSCSRTRRTRRGR